MYWGGEGLFLPGCRSGKEKPGCPTGLESRCVGQPGALKTL